VESYATPEDATTEEATTEDAAAGGGEMARELLPMVITAPISTPMVTLRADAVNAMPAPRRT
jgi:hypothetical protein